MKRFSSLLFVFFYFGAWSQSIDVLHYRFEIELSDNSDAINGKAFITVKFTGEASALQLDLTSGEDEKGMYVFEVKENGKKLVATHRNNIITINLDKPVKNGEVRTFEISYMGTPKDGLIISKNKYNDRTFFADNWPDRAHQWIPCNDRPDDKASVEFLVTAPCHYQVVSNGIQVEETNIDKNQKLTHWREKIPVSTKIMVIGAAQFAVVRVDDHDSIPVTAWVYPQNKEKGIYDYSVAPRMLRFFTNYIGPYPFEKLANVQSTTIFGGMENASAIFYDERAINVRRTSEPTVAHEIVQQWFGDMAAGRI